MTTTSSPPVSILGVIVAIVCVAGSAAVLIALPELVDALTPYSWIAKSWQQLMQLTMGAAGLLSVIGIATLRSALHWPRTSWRGRALVICLVPSFFVPAWIAVHRVDAADQAQALAHSR